MLRSIGRLLARLIPTGLPFPVLAGPLRGRRWIVGALAGRGKGLSLMFNRIEPGQMAAADERAPRDGVCFDIGANVGLYTVLYARHCRHVYAFEPLPRNVRYLSRIVDMNRLANVTIVPCAVADRVGLASFETGANVALGRLGEGGAQPVSVVSCDEVVRVLGVVPAIIKIDVEGAEREVLHGAETTLRSHHPILMLSVHSDELRATCLEHVRALGYTRVQPLNAPDEDTATEYAISVA